ncbi:MAG TPA: serine O-acetyltransferase [Polyangiaceae bacterium]|jgi:serine O-acetyltransferase
MLFESPSASIQKAVETLFQDYTTDERAHRIGKRFVPSREEIFAILQLLLELSYPGFYGPDNLAEEHLEGHLAVVVSTLHEKLARQIEACLRHDEETEGAGPDSRPPHRTGGELAGEFLRRLPLVRRRLVLDVEAAYDGDPAAASVDEVILAYPGLLAVTVHRLAHELYRMGVPLMPRIMAEWAHTRTGADIHPGATIGDRFFIDHATGVVIGETTIIGVRVKLYQGVTLGALSLPHAARGARGAKRHPTVEDDVTVYANATVLGGDTVLGRECVVGGGVFITKSVPPRTRVAIEAPRLRVAAPRSAGGDGAASTDPWSDFEI